MKKTNNNKPMLFSTPMVQAIVANMKTVTRREINGNSTEMISLMINILCGVNVEENKEELLIHSRIKKGNILWVREAWNYSDDLNDPYLYRQIILDDYLPEYHNMYKWKPSIHMPKDAARIFLKVVDVKIELLQSISESDAVAEGVDVFKGLGLRKAPTTMFKELWQKINGVESWNINPLVWVIAFEWIEKPVDF